MENSKDKYEADRNKQLEALKETLRKSQEARSNTNLVADVGQIGAKYIENMGGVKADPSLSQGMRDRAQLGVKEATGDVSKFQGILAKLKESKEKASRQDVLDTRYEESTTYNKKMDKAKQEAAELRDKEAIRSNKAKEGQKDKERKIQKIQEDADRQFKYDKLDQEKALKDREYDLEKQKRALATSPNSKEAVKIRQENRKLVQKLDTAAETALNKLAELQRVKREAQIYSTKSKTGGFGPIATAGGLKKYTDSELQRIDSMMKKIGLDEMVKMFAGMSKAVDSDAERRAFESTIPSITLDEPALWEVINSRIAATESLLKKTRDKRAMYGDTGEFIDTPSQGVVEPTLEKPETQTTEAPKTQTTERVTIYKNGSAMGTIPKTQIKQAEAEGYSLTP